FSSRRRHTRSTRDWSSDVCSSDLKEYFLDEIGHYVYGGDTALHVAAAAYRHDIARRLIAAGANLRARNRRGAEPLHYAVDGMPRSEERRVGTECRTRRCAGVARGR